MALVQCCECGKNFSDKLSVCPECGAPATMSTPPAISPNAESSMMYVASNTNISNNAKMCLLYGGGSFCASILILILQFLTGLSHKIFDYSVVDKFDTVFGFFIGFLVFLSYCSVIVCIIEGLMFYHQHLSQPTLGGKSQAKVGMTFAVLSIFCASIFAAAKDIF